MKKWLILQLKYIINAISSADKNCFEATHFSRYDYKPENKIFCRRCTWCSRCTHTEFLRERNNSIKQKNNSELISHWQRKPRARAAFASPPWQRRVELKIRTPRLIAFFASRCRRLFFPPTPPPTFFPSASKFFSDPDLESALFFSRRTSRIFLSCECARESSLSLFPASHSFWHAGALLQLLARTPYLWSRVVSLAPRALLLLPRAIRPNNFFSAILLPEVCSLTRSFLRSFFHARLLTYDYVRVPAKFRQR